jgi:hypothetical protein
VKSEEESARKNVYMGIGSMCLGVEKSLGMVRWVGKTPIGLDTRAGSDPGEARMGELVELVLPGTYCSVDVFGMYYKHEGCL